MLPKKINLKNKFSEIEGFWNPHVIGRLNGQLVKVARFKGPFVWHSHEEEDELFFVIKGNLTILFREGQVELTAGEMLIVPRKEEHCPQADEEVWVMLFEPETTVNTGDNEGPLTRKKLNEI